MLGIVATATEATTNSQTGIDLETRRAVRIQQLQRSRTLPVASVVVGIRIDACRRIKQMGQIRGNRQRRDGLQSILNSCGPFLLNNSLVDAIIDDVISPR